MKNKISIPITMIILLGINLGLFAWNANLERGLKPQQVPYLDGIMIHYMVFDAENRLWTVGPSGIHVFQNGKIVETYSETKVEAIKDVLPHSGDVRLYFDRQNNPWLVAGNHLYVLENDKWVKFGTDFIQINIGISALSFDRQGRIWAGTYYDNGLIVIDGLSSIQYTTQNSELAHNHIRDITIDSAGKIWIATSGGGINIVDGNEWQILNTINSPLASDYVNTVRFDANERAWIGTSKGLQIFDGQNWETYSENNSPLTSGVWNINLTKTGKAWLGYDTVFLSEKWEYYFIPTKPFENVWVSKIFDEQGNLFILPQFEVPQKVLFVPAGVRLCSAFEVFLSFMVVSGGFAFLSILLIEIRLAFLWKVRKPLWVSLGLAFFVGLFFFWLWTTSTVSLVQMRYENQVFFISNPGFAATLSIMTSTLIAKTINPSKKAESIGLIIGWVVGIPLGIIALISAAISMMGPM